MIIFISVKNMSTDHYSCGILHGMESRQIGDRNLEILNGIAYNLIKEFDRMERDHKRRYGSDSNKKCTFS